VKIDDWVTVNNEVGVVSSIAPDSVTIRIPQVDWPFPKYVTVSRKQIKKAIISELKQEPALL
jgi:sRNA-binding carbon storage regulator CsrA